MKANPELKQYLSDFLISYADYLAFFQAAHIQILSELESAFIHLINSHNLTDQNLIDDNVNKINSHLVRATLDCRKFIWIELNEILDEICKNPKQRKLCTNDTDYNFMRECQIFFKKTSSVRKLEIKNVGVDQKSTINEYSELIDMGLKITNKIDQTKLIDYEKYIKKIGIGMIVNEITISFVMGVIIATVSFFILEI